MQNPAIDSDNEGKIVYSAGHYFRIVNGVRQWLTLPPDDYICTDGTNFSDLNCRHSDTTQEEWFSMRISPSLGV